MESVFFGHDVSLSYTLKFLLVSQKSAVDNEVC